MDGNWIADRQNNHKNLENADYIVSKLKAKASQEVHKEASLSIESRASNQLWKIYQQRKNS